MDTIYSLSNIFTRGNLARALKFATTLLIGLAVAVFALGPIHATAQATQSVYAVNTTDDVDDGACNATHCSLREAINAANANPGADTITFNIPGGSPFSIQPASALPEITDPVTIDGTTQPGYAGNPIVGLDGSNAGEEASGLVISAGDSMVRGLVINRFAGDGIVLILNGGNTIQGNFIGTDVTGTAHMGNYRGVNVQEGSSENLIGGLEADDGNLISGNEAAGIRFSDEGTEGNTVQGNFIGTDVTGMSRLGNNIGVRITEGAADNLIGGAEAGARNIISGNDDTGVYIDQDEVVGTTGNTVQGNYIGTDVTGSAPTAPAVGEYTVTSLEETCPTYPAETDYDGFVSGSDDPVAPWEGTSVHFVGTDECSNEMLGEASLIYRYKLEFAEETELTSIAVAGAGFRGPDSILRVLDEGMNVLGSAETMGGNNFQVQFVTLQDAVGTVFYVDEFDTSTTWRYREIIFINASALGNYPYGVGIAGGASDNLILQNLISGNLGDGVKIFDLASGNVLQGNFIGTDFSGSTALPNLAVGVVIDNAENNLITGNVLSSNGWAGIGLFEGSSGNIMRGNLIGTNADGTEPLPNVDGVWFGGEANNNTIGGTTPEERNVISANTTFNVSLNEGASENLILGNYIGTDKTGTFPLGTSEGGVFLGSGSVDNMVGGTQAGARNLISGNLNDGVIIGEAASGNLVQGNFIGTDVTGMLPLGISGSGVIVYGETSDNLIGGTQENAGNLISGNGGGGVLFIDEGAEGNKIQGNLIGTDISGMSPLGNGFGVGLAYGPKYNLIGGTDPGAGNIISGNDGGVFLYGDGVTGNLVQGNFIGTDASGLTPLGNESDGIVIGGNAANNLIGGTEPGAGNLISGNKGSGVVILDPGTTGNTVQGNFIGTDVTGSTVTVPAGPDPGDFEVTVDEVCPTYPAGTDIEGWVSESDDPLAPWSGISVLFQGTDECDLEPLGEASLIYRYRLEFAEETELTSIAVTGGNFNGPDNVLRVLDADGNVLATTTTFENPYMMLKDVSGSVFFVEEYDSSSEFRFRQSIVVNGPIPLGNALDGVYLAAGAAENLIGGIEPGARNLISGNNGMGVSILDPDTTGNMVQGNSIGTDVTGMVALGNLGRGILVEGGPTGNLIGGTQAHAGNLISGNELAGIGVFGEGTEGNQIQGNFIGTDITGMNPLGNGLLDGLPGIRIGESAANNLVGGTEPGAGNTIAYNGAAGMALSDDAGSGNSLLSNSVFSNVGLGIDLGDDGVTANDLRDPDTGPNDLQNYPFITTINPKRTSVTIYGFLVSTPNTTFRLEFFSNEACDESGYGEGQAFLGFASVRTNPAGIARLNISLPVTIPPGGWVTATATDPAGNTSEFSNCVNNKCVAAVTFSEEAVTVVECVAGMSNLYLPLAIAEK